MKKISKKTCIYFKTSFILLKNTTFLLNVQSIYVTKTYIFSEIKSGHLRFIPCLIHSDTVREEATRCAELSFGEFSSGSTTKTQIWQGKITGSFSTQRFITFDLVQKKISRDGGVKNKSGEYRACCNPCDWKPR